MAVNTTHYSWFVGPLKRVQIINEMVPDMIDAAAEAISWTMGQIWTRGAQFVFLFGKSILEMYNCREEKARDVG